MGCAPRARHGERGHRRRGARRPPAPPPGGLAAARLRPVPRRHRGRCTVSDLGAAGPSRDAARCPLRGPVLPRHRVHDADPARLRPAAYPHRVAALAPLALVGQGHGRRTGRVARGGDAGALVVGPLRPGGRRPVRLPRPRRGPAGRQPDGPGGHQPRRTGRRRLAGGALPPRPRGGAPAAALGGVGGGPGGAGRPGDGCHGRGHLGGQCVGLVALPLALGAAILRYRLYDLDRVISRTLAYGLLTVLLGGGYAGVVLGLGQLLGRQSSLVVAGATLAVAVVFLPARRRVQHMVDRRFNRRRYDAARTIEAFAARLRQQIDLDALTAELLTVVDQTMQPMSGSLWLRPTPGQQPPPTRAASPPATSLTRDPPRTEAAVPETSRVRRGQRR